MGEKHVAPVRRHCMAAVWQRLRTAAVQSEDVVAGGALPHGRRVACC